MFRKVHHRLTLLCAGITTLILLTLSFIYLYVSETGLMKNQFLSFQRDVNTVISNFGCMNTNEIVHAMHNEEAYKLTEEKEIISYKHADKLSVT